MRRRRPGRRPADQRPDDGASLCWDSEPLDERIELLGHAAAVLELESDRPLALVVARLCEVAPDGASTLIARGVLNLTHREGHDRVVPLVPGEPVTVRVPMQSTAYAVPAGHALRLAVSPTYWPWIWPSPEPVTLTVVSGGASRLELPVRSAVRAGRRAAAVRSARGGGRAPKTSTGGSGRSGGPCTRDLATGAVDVEFPWIDHVHRSDGERRPSWPSATSRTTG